MKYNKNFPRERGNMVAQAVSALQTMIHLVQTATARSRNPLGFLAGVFLVSYSVVGSVLTAATLTEELQAVLATFLVTFPVFILAIFAYLASRHHLKFYGPHDFREEGNFVTLSRRESGVPVRPRKTDPSPPSSVGQLGDEPAEVGPVESQQPDFQNNATMSKPPEMLCRITQSLRGFETVRGEDFCMRSQPSPANRPNPGLYVSADDTIYCVSKEFEILLLDSAVHPPTLTPVSSLPSDARLFRGRRINRDVDIQAESADDVVEASFWNETIAARLSLQQAATSIGLESDLRPVGPLTRRQRRRRA